MKAHGLTLYTTCGGQWRMPLRMTVNRNWTYKTNPLIVNVSKHTLHGINFPPTCTSIILIKQTRLELQKARTRAEVDAALNCYLYFVCLERNYIIETYLK